MSVIEVISFDGGINTKKDAIFLKEGELVSSEGFLYDRDGILETRTPKTKVNSTAIGSINGMHRHINTLYATDTQNIYTKWDLNGYCNLYTGTSDFTTIIAKASARPKFIDYGHFTFAVMGANNKVFPKGGNTLIPANNYYSWDIKKPSSVRSTFIAGESSGETDSPIYFAYSWLIYFPNGFAAESPISDIDYEGQPYYVDANRLTFLHCLGGYPLSRGLLALSCFQQYYPNCRLDVKYYRSKGATSSGQLNATPLYHVGTSSDKDAQNYVNPKIYGILESYSPTTILTLDQLETDSYNYSIAGTFNDAANHLSRIWGIKENTLYPSEEYQPFYYNTGNSFDVSEWGEDQEGTIAWGGSLYIYSPRSIHRLTGTTTAYFGIYRTPAEQGFINKHTVKGTRYGIIGLWHDGIYLFNGTHNVKITGQKISDSFFKDMGTKSACYAEWDGVRYHFIYPTSGTTLNRRLIVDFTHYPDLRFYHDDFVPTSYQYHVPTGIKYYGKSDGYQYQDSTSETIATSAQSRDLVAKNVYAMKEAEFLYYDINTGGKDVVLTFYTDGNAESRQITLNHSARTKKRIQLPKFEGYRFSMKIDCSDAVGVSIYQPWGISFNVPSTE